MRISQADIGERIVRVLCDRLIVVLDGFAQVRASSLLGEKFSSEIKLVSFRIHRRHFRNRILLGTAESCLQRLGDRFRNLALDREYVGQFAIVSLGPEMRVGHRADELDVNANLIADSLDAALKEIRNPQPGRNLSKIFWRAFKMLRKGA